MSTFTFSNPLSGSVYFVIETVRNSQQIYDSSSLQTIVGTINNFSNINPNGLVTSSYILGVVVSPGNSSFDFIPTIPIDPNNVYLRGTGPLTVTIDSNPPLTPNELYGPGILNNFIIDGGSYPSGSWNIVSLLWNQITSFWEQPII
jgi:hypothetical protein